MAVSFRLKSWQTAWLGLQLLALAIFAAFTDFEILFGDPMGRRLAVGAALLAVLNFAILAGGCTFLNWMSAPKLALARNILSGLLLASCFMLFFLPTLFVLWTGPAAVTIQRNLSMD